MCVILFECNEKTGGLGMLLIRNSLQICAFSIKGWITNMRFYASLLISVVVFLINAMRMYEFSKYLGEPLGLFDVFIYTTSDIYSVVALFLGLLLLLSDVPFSSSQATYTLLRTSKIGRASCRERV